jgi:methionine biosynthesis protein MetW
MTHKRSLTLPNGEAIEFPTGWRGDAALAHVRACRRLLDVGCGRGAVASALRDRCEQVFGLDADPEALAVASRRGVDVIEGDLNEPLPFDDATFDGALCLEVLEHVLRPDLLLREIARVLEPSAYLYVSTPNIRHVRHLYELAVRGRFPLTSGDPDGFQGGHVHFFTWGDLEGVLEKSGFSVSERVSLPLGRRLADLLAPGIFVVAERRGPLPLVTEVRQAPRNW